MGIFFSAYNGSDFFGKLIFLSLFVLSILTWYILMQKGWSLYKVKSLSNIFSNALSKQKEGIINVDIDALPINSSANAPNPFASIYLALKKKSLELLEKNRYFATYGKSVFLSQADVELVEAHVQSTISNEMKKLESNLFILATTVSLAPFLGILGTVWGILISLNEMQAGASHSNAIILGGLSTALATTVLGLVIAIPALIGYNYLKSSVKEQSSDMHDFSNLLLSTLELQYRQVET